MTENLPARRDDDTPREIARADTDSWIEVVGQVAKFAGYIAGTEFVPKSLRDNPAAATAAMMYGREVGLPPMTALTQTHVIEGRPSMSAEAQRAMVLAAGHDIEVIESTGAICRMRGRRRGSERWSAEVVWSIDMARAAGLLNKNNWKSYPRAMLSARCSAELCTLHFPDVTLGFRSVEELEDLGGVEQDSVEATPAAAKSRVTRKRATKKPESLPAAPAPSERPDAPAGPPLPGEDGYDQPREADEQVSAGESGDGPPASQAEDAGNDDEDAPADTEEPPSPGGEGDEGEGEPGPGKAGSPSPTTEEKPTRPASRAQQRMMFASLGELGVAKDDDEERLLIASKIVSRPVESFNKMTSREASHLIDTLARCGSKADLWALLDELDAAVEAESP